MFHDMKPETIERRKREHAEQMRANLYRLQGDLRAKVEQYADDQDRREFWQDMLDENIARNGELTQ